MRGGHSPRWSAADDARLLRLLRQIRGRGRWARLAKRFPTRTSKALMVRAHKLAASEAGDAPAVTRRRAARRPAVAPTPTGPALNHCPNCGAHLALYHEALALLGALPNG